MATYESRVECEVYCSNDPNANFDKCQDQTLTLFYHGGSQSYAKFKRKNPENLTKKRRKKATNVNIYVVSKVNNTPSATIGYINQVPISGIVVNDYNLVYIGYGINHITVSYNGGYPLPPNNFNDSVTFCTDISTHKPYILDTLEDIVPEARNLSPTIFVDETKPSIFSWDFYAETPDNGIPLIQKSATVQCTDGGDFECEVYVNGSSQSYQFPAGTFPENGTFKWRVKVVSDDNISSEWSDWQYVTTVDVPGSVTSIYPSNVVVYGDVDNRISWRYENANGTEQGGYEIEKSIDGINWTALASASSGNQYADISAGTFTAKKMWIRIRAYNSSGLVSEWTESEFTVRSAPPKPSIVSVVTDSDKPTFKWGSVDQETYHIAIYDSQGAKVYDKNVVGNEKQHKLTKRIDDGTYTVLLSIRNKYNLVSRKAERSFTIATAKPQKPSLVAVANDEVVNISLNNTTDSAVLIRNGIAIADVSGQAVYSDNTAFGECTYILRALSENSFNDSVPQNVAVDIKYGILSSADNPSNSIALKFKANSPPNYTSSVESEYSSMSFAGRKYPVFEFGEHQTESKSLAYSVLTADEVKKIKSFSGKPILWRDSNGKLYGTMTNLQVAKKRLYFDISFNVVKTDVSEVVLYD